MMQFACPTCQTPLKAPEDKAGAMVACPRCKGRVKIPSPSGATGQVPASPTAALSQSSPIQTTPAPVPTENWFYACAGKKNGPVSWQQLKQLASDRQFRANDLVWKQGMAKWAPAGTIPDLVPDGENHASDGRSMDSGSPGWKRVLGEVPAVAVATWTQTFRPFSYFSQMRKKKALEKGLRSAQLALGWKLYKGKVGDGQVRVQIDALEDQINSAGVETKDGKQLEGVRRRLLEKLAAPVTGGAAPTTSSIATEYQEVKKAEKELREYKKHLVDSKAGLLPSGAADWIRVGVGYSLVGAILAVTALTLLPRTRVDPDATASVGETKSDGDKSKTPVDQQTKVDQQAPTIRSKMTGEEIYQKTSKSVALIRSDRGSGTGFMVRKGILATNWHVISDSPVERFRVYFPSVKDGGNNPITPKRLLYENKKRDLAFFTIDSEQPALDVAETYDFSPGQVVTVIGSPGIGDGQVLENAITQGSMSTKTNLGDMEYYQLGIPLNPGNSGGPVFDPTGQVIGVVARKAGRQESIAFCIPVKDLNEALEKALKRTPEDVDRATSRHNLEIVFRRVNHASRWYSEALDLINERMIDSIKKKKQPAEGALAARAMTQSRLAEIEKMDIDGIRAFVANLPKDASVLSSHRDPVLEFWKNYVDMKELVDKPGVDQRAFDTKRRELQVKYVRKRDELIKTLEIEERE